MARFLPGKIYFGGGSLRFLTVLANFLAKYALPRWNKCRPLRKVCRSMLYAMCRLYAAHWRSEFKDVIGTGWTCNTYPWPYSDPKFAPWEEDDRPETYTLVSDPAGFVIRRSTSYVAWKIFELTGRWPLERGNEGKIFHAKYWQEFLALNGYDKVVAQPEHGRHYVGIIPSEGEFGQVVWYEGVYKGKYMASTYLNFRHELDRNYDINQATWIEIC